MSELRFRTVVADPERALGELQAKQTELEKALEDVRQQIKLAKRILDTQRGWVEMFGADPAPEDDRPPPAQSSETTQITKLVSMTPPPRRVQVVRLLSQDPTYWWKTRDIAEALTIDNQKSLRVLLGQLARKGELIKTRSLVPLQRRHIDPGTRICLYGH